MENNFHKTQLCWTCARACGGCSWSAEFKPVRGWKAKKTKLYVDRGEHNKHYTTSYRIKECPLYKDDRPKQEPKAGLAVKPFVKRTRKPFVMRGTQREKIFAMPDLIERISRLKGEAKTIAELVFVYYYNFDDAAAVTANSRSCFKKKLKATMNEIEVIA